MPHPRRGSELVSGGLRAAKNSSRRLPTPTNQHRRPACRPCICTAFGFGARSEARCGGARWPSRHPSCRKQKAESGRVSTTEHQGSHYLLQGKRICHKMSVQSLNKGLV
jgi:hypothetical protein